MVCGYILDWGIRARNYHLPKQSPDCTKQNVLGPSHSQIHKNDGATWPVKGHLTKVEEDVNHGLCTSSFLWLHSLRGRSSSDRRNPLGTPLCLSCPWGPHIPRARKGPHSLRPRFQLCSLCELGQGVSHQDKGGEWRQGWSCWRPCGSTRFLRVFLWNVMYIAQLSISDLPRMYNCTAALPCLSLSLWFAPWPHESSLAVPMVLYRVRKVLHPNNVN